MHPSLRIIFIFIFTIHLALMVNCTSPIPYNQQQIIPTDYSLNQNTIPYQNTIPVSNTMPYQSNFPIVGSSTPFIGSNTPFMGTSFPSTSYLPGSTSYMSPETSYMPTSTSYMPPTTSYMPSTTSYMPPTTSYMPSTTSYMPPTTSYMPSTTSYMPPTTSFMPPTSSYMPSSYMPTTSYAPSSSSSYLPLSTEMQPSFNIQPATSIMPDQSNYFQQMIDCYRQPGFSGASSYPFYNYQQPLLRSRFIGGDNPTAGYNMFKRSMPIMPTAAVGTGNFYPNYYQIQGPETIKTQGRMDIKTLGQPPIVKHEVSTCMNAIVTCCPRYLTGGKDRDICLGQNGCRGPWGVHPCASDLAKQVTGYIKQQTPVTQK